MDTTPAQGPGKGNYVHRVRPAAERFAAKVRRGSSDECWEWTAATRNGYGHFMDDGQALVYAHRFAWAQANGPIPDGLHVLHHCDNRPCVNPAHLYAGTNADNVRDKMARGRHRIRSGQ